MGMGGGHAENGTQMANGTAEGGQSSTRRAVWDLGVGFDAKRVGKRAFRTLVSGVLRCGPLPHHVAFIMDGNRRWAERKKLDRREGHAFGFTQLKECLKWCLDLGISVVTVYAFSIENFKRPRHEVDSLMDLAVAKLDELSRKRGFLERNQIRVQVLGDLSLLPAHVRVAAARAMYVSRNHGRAVLNICLAYTSREEILRACDELAQGVRRGDLGTCDVCEDLVSQALYTGPHSQVDLLIRTSGETRMSDFLLWQASLSCASFQPVLWPDFSLSNLAAGVLSYQSSHAALMQARGRHREAAACQGGGTPGGGNPAAREEFVRRLRGRREAGLYALLPQELTSPSASDRDGANIPSDLLGGDRDLGGGGARLAARAAVAWAELCAWGVLCCAGAAMLRARA